MTSVTIEQLAPPSSERERRALDWTRDWAVDELAGRTVWSAAALPWGRHAAQALQDHLDWAQDAGVGAASLVVDGQRLRDEVDVDGMRACDDLVRGRVGPDDVVVLHDALAAMLTPAIREQGAHAVWQVTVAAADREAVVGAVWTFLQPYVEAVDAFFTTWSEPVRSGRRSQRVAALMPSPDAVAAMQTDAGGAAERCDDVCWTSMLAEVVVADRAERVGGRRHARPAVAAR